MAAQPGAPPGPGEPVDTSDIQFHKIGKFHFALRPPKTGADGLPIKKGRADNSAWPLLFVLHSAGERGPPDGSKKEDILRHGPWNCQTVQAFCVLAPQCHSGATWSAVAPELVALIEEACIRWPLDRSRLYACGVSMGAFGIWSCAAAKPNLFAAIVPICGGFAPVLPPNTGLAAVLKQGHNKVEKETVEPLTHLSVFLIHGEVDPIVDIKASRELYYALGGKNRRDSLKLLVLRNAGHQCWTRAYQQPDLFGWLGRQRNTHPDHKSSAPPKLAVMNRVSGSNSEFRGSELAVHDAPPRRPPPNFATPSEPVRPHQRSAPAPQNPSRPPPKKRSKHGASGSQDPPNVQRQQPQSIPEPQADSESDSGEYRPGAPSKIPQKKQVPKPAASNPTASSSSRNNKKRPASPSGSDNGNDSDSSRVSDIVAMRDKMGGLPPPDDEETTLAVCPRDHYATLCITDKTCSFEVINSSFKKQAKHCFATKGDKKKRFDKIQFAYEVLSAPVVRWLYDMNADVKMERNENIGIIHRKERGKVKYIAKTSVFGLYIESPDEENTEIILSWYVRLCMLRNEMAGFCQAGLPIAEVVCKTARERKFEELHFPPYFQFKVHSIDAEWIWTPPTEDWQMAILFKQRFESKKLKHHKMDKRELLEMLLKEQDKQKETVRSREEQDSGNPRTPISS